MADQNKKNHFPGGLALLAAAAMLCVRGLQQTEQRLRKHKKT